MVMVDLGQVVTERDNIVTKYRKIMLTLPPETARTLKETKDRATLFAHLAALRDGGWTMECMADVVGVSRERVRQLIQKAGPIEQAKARSAAAGFVVPELPAIPERERPVRLSPIPENLHRLRELQPLAQQVRANSPRYREEAEEYTRLIYFEHGRGVSIYHLAQLLGVTHGALRYRLVRYGYKHTDAKSKVYKRILDKNRSTKQLV